jgi:hypothetical protein
MNITTTNNSNVSNWKRTIKGQYVVAAAGVALAMSAVFVSGITDRGSSQPSTVQHASVSSSLRVVSDADIAAGVLSSELANFGPNAATPVMRQASRADIDAAVLSTELANFAVPSRRVASEADTMAGVLSSERAAFGD